MIVIYLFTAITLLGVFTLIELHFLREVKRIQREIDEFIRHEQTRNPRVFTDEQLTAFRNELNREIDDILRK